MMRRGIDFMPVIVIQTTNLLTNWQNDNSKCKLIMGKLSLAAKRDVALQLLCLRISNIFSCYPVDLYLCSFKGNGC
jgi:hypothetical protein